MMNAAGNAGGSPLDEGRSRQLGALGRTGGGSTMFAEGFLGRPLFWAGMLVILGGVTGTVISALLHEGPSAPTLADIPGNELAYAGLLGALLGFIAWATLDWALWGAKLIRSRTAAYLPDNEIRQLWDRPFLPQIVLMVAGGAGGYLCTDGLYIPQGDLLTGNFGPHHIMLVYAVGGAVTGVFMGLFCALLRRCRPRLL